MSIPTFETMLRPILALSASGPITRALVAEKMARHFNLSVEEQAARIPSGGSTYVANRSGWSMTFLTKAGLIEKVAPKQYRATDRGRQFLAEHPESIAVSDLRAVEGWSQAWGDGEDAMADAPPEVDDDDQSPAAFEARVQWTVERALPDPIIRKAVLEFLAFAIENADEERPDAWHIRAGRRRLELKTGRLLALRIERGRMGVSVVGPIAEDVRAILGLRDEDGEAWKLIEGGLYFTLVPEQAANGLDQLREPLARFIDAAMGRLRSRVDVSEHSAEAVSYLSKVVGRDLPQPETHSAVDENEAGETSEAEGQVSREPVVRGRVPIFEHGQRAISSLVEDVDPERGAIALPDLQRPFVWEDTKVRDLLDSLFIGFPVGTLVLWYTADEREARALGSASRVLRATTLVIDGQQRLTSLYAVMRGKEIQDKDGNRRRITIAFRPRDGRFEVADAAIVKDPEFVADVSELWKGPRTPGQIRRDLFKKLAESGRTVDDAYTEAVEVNLERAHGIGAYRFPTVEIRKTASADIDEEDVADIFVRINNQGSRLGQSDFVLTLLSVFHGELRDRIETRAREMSRDAVVPIDTQQVLRTSCAVGFGRARMSAIYKYIRGIDPITGDANPARRVERLETLDRAADECLDSTRWRDYMLRVMHAGFVTDHLVASTNAVTNAYAFYVLGRRSGAGKARIEEGISRWLFGTLSTARYSGSSESKFEEDLARVSQIPTGDVDAFVSALDGMLADVLTDDYWTRTLPAALETQRGRAPAALAFRAAQIVVGTRALFSDQLLQNLLAPPAGGTRKASEMHHLFPKAWLQKRGVTDRRRINQVANLADVGWHENGSLGAESPAKYAPRIREQLKLTDDRWGRMCAEHALPIGWESMEYDEFLASRRPRMAEIVRIAFRKLGGEQDASPLTPPWFLPGGEVVWQRIADVERGLRRVVRDVYAGKFGTRAVEAISDALEANEREHLSRATRNRPSTADPMTVVDYLYLSQLPKLLFRSEVWAEARVRLGNDAEAKRRLQTAVESIAPVRNEIAHVREVSPDRLQRASVACSDVMGMLGNG